MGVDAGGADQATFAQALQRIEQIVVDVVRGGAMQLVDVQVIQAKVAQRGFAAGGDGRRREIALFCATDAGLSGQCAALAGDDQ